jgi:hypothetical protein
MLSINPTTDHPSRRVAASGPTGTNRVIVALREEVRMDETQEKCVIERAIVKRR